MLRSGLSLALSGLMLAGCSVSYPPLFTIPAISPSDPQTGLETILIQASSAQNTYGSYYLKSAKNSDLAQLPLVGAASLAAGILYGGGKNTQNHLAGIGIGVGGYTAYKNVIMPGGLPEIYLKGHSALGCIRLEGVNFVGSQALMQHRSVEQEAQRLAARIADAKFIYGSSVISAGASVPIKAQFQSASSTLNLSINSASEIAKKTNMQLGSFRNAETIFGTAVSNVQYKVALAARAGRTVDFSDLKNSITANITDAAGAGPPPAPAAIAGIKSDIQIINDVVSTSATLMQNAQELDSKIPKYIESLERVAACSNIIS